MKILIIEDEPLAAERLQRLVLELVEGATILGKIDSVKRAVTWFNNNPAPDVVLMDIQLADGISFQIFEKCEVKAPVIFTTAYEEYALRAFKVNSVDYILKPVDKKELASALHKVKTRSAAGEERERLLERMSDMLDTLSRKFKTRFLIKVGEHLRTVEIDQILFFYSHDKATFCVTEDHRRFFLDYTIERLEGLVDPKQFYRINRKYLVRAAAILDVVSYSNSRLKLKLRGSQDQDIIVARERIQEFKEWLDT